MKFEELIKTIRLLNPDVEIRVGNPLKDQYATSRIFATVAGSELKLPEGFKYDNNGINNLHHSTSGASIMIDVEPLTKDIEKMLLPEDNLDSYRVIQNNYPVNEAVRGKVRNIAVEAISSLYHKVFDGKRKGV